MQASDSGFPIFICRCVYWFITLAYKYMASSQSSHSHVTQRAWHATQHRCSHRTSPTNFGNLTWDPLKIVKRSIKSLKLGGLYHLFNPGGVHWVPEQLNINAVINWACKLTDGSSLISCVWPHLQWHHLVYATEIKVNSTACSASVTGLKDAQYMCRTFTFTFTYLTSLLTACCFFFLNQESYQGKSV